MSTPRRALILFLAAFPATWGLCVGRLVRSAAAETSSMASTQGLASAEGVAATAVPAPVVPSCCHAEPPPPARSQGSEDAPEAPRSPEPCGCGWSEAGRGVLPAEAVPALPDLEVAADFAEASPAPGSVSPSAAEGSRASAPVAEPEPPRERLAGVRLLD